MWSADVVIKTDSLGAFPISSLQEALACLRSDWPSAKRCGLLYERALEVCDGAEKGDLKMELARKAFIAAARDAELLSGESIGWLQPRRARKPE